MLDLTIFNIRVCGPMILRKENQPTPLSCKCPPDFPSCADCVHRVLTTYYKSMNYLRLKNYRDRTERKLPTNTFSPR